MKPVTQTRVGRPEGNCTEAAIASILEVELDQVPQLWDPSDTTDKDQRPQHRINALSRWIRQEHGRVWVSARFAPVVLPIDESVKDRFPGLRHHFSGYTMLCGMNLDGVGHATVGLDGAIVWDPNPLRRGLVSCDEVISLCREDLLLALYGVDHVDVAPECGVAVFGSES